MIEIWKPVKDYEGIYQVSNFGNVKSLERKVWMQRNNCFRVLKEKGGYLHVSLCNKGCKFTIKKSLLVAIAFLNHKPNGYELVINHKNFIRTDDNSENLELITQRENANKKHIKSSSKYVGVSWHKRDNKWISSIKVNGKLKFLGYFKTELEASEVYQKELKTITFEKL